ncbi:hypothetical protein [Pseudomonas purpurea]|uniref:hypothetical protein n=1 Tax=Pseudomonas purpurea TaxID=3136737 RepID=UPI0032658F1F
MKVVCTINNLNDLQDPDVSARLRYYIRMPGGEIDLEPGKTYTVYGIEMWDNCPWFYLCNALDDEYPKPYAADLFKVVDERFSTYWRLSFDQEARRAPATRFVFDIWADDPLFYEQLIDGEPGRVSTFARYRALMENEYT